MAVLADVCCGDVGRVFTGRADAVVAIGAVVHDVRVIKIRRRPRNGRVAVVAVIATRNMGRVFAGSSYAIVTGATGSEYLGVVDGRDGTPLVTIVAILAGAGRLDVRLAFACRSSAVMATFAVVEDVGVIEIDRNPRDGGVAVVAGISRLDVVRVLACRGHAVMAGGATADHVQVLDLEHWCPTRGRVAGFANHG